MADLEKLYTEAKHELSAKHLDRASALFKQILVQDENYKDASRLLAKIIQRRRRRWYSHPLLFAGLACIALAIIGVFVLPGILETVNTKDSSTPLIVTTSQITNVAETSLPTFAITPTTAPLPFHWVRINNGQDFPRDAIVALAADPADPDVIYAGMRNAGVYKTINGGESWHPANAGIESMAVKTLIIDPVESRTLFLHAGDGLFKTSNGAVTWKKLLDIDTFVMDPKDSRHLYATAGTITETLDGGETWSSPANAERIKDDIFKIEVDLLDSNKLYTLCRSGVYVSKNSGVKWQLIKQFNNPINIAVTLLPDGQVGVVVAGGDPEHLGGLWLYKTAESKWIVKERTCGIFAVDPDNPASIYCNQYHSQDGGITWPEGINSSFWWVNRTNVISLTGGKNPVIFLAGEEGQMFRSTNGGSTFSPISSNGLPGVGYELSISPFNDSMLILVQKDCDWQCSSSFISINGGVNWQPLTKGGGSSDFAFDADGSTIHTYGMDYENVVPLLWTSKDAGKTWTSHVISGAQGSLQGIWISPVQPGALVIYLDYPEYRLIRTLDGGKTWEEIPGSFSLDRTFSFFGHGTRVFAYDGNSSSIIYSDDLFSTIHSCADLSAYGIGSKPAIAVMPDSRYVLYNTLGGIGVVRSIGQCAQWDPLLSQPGNINIHSLAVDPNNTDVVYASTNEGVYITLDAGEHWGLVTEGLLGANLIYSLRVDSKGNVLAVTPYGIFKLEQK